MSQRKQFTITIIDNEFEKLLEKEAQLLAQDLSAEKDAYENAENLISDFDDKVFTW